MIDAEKAAAYDRLCEMLLVPPGAPAAAAYGALGELVDQRNEARCDLEDEYQEKARLDSLRYALCLSNEGLPSSLKEHAVYRVETDPAAEAAGLLSVVDESGESRHHTASRFAPITLGPSMALALQEVEHCHRMLGMIYGQLCVLEHSHESVEQARLCPTDWCKYWKQPEWLEKRVYYGSAEGKAAVKATLRACAKQLLTQMEEAHPGDDQRRTQPLRSMLEAWNEGGRDE